MIVDDKETICIYSSVHRHSVPVETVKEMVMNPEDKKITEEKESETTDETLSKTGTPANDPTKSPAQKNKPRSNRYCQLKNNFLFINFKQGCFFFFFFFLINVQKS